LKKTLIRGETFCGLGIIIISIIFFILTFNGPFEAMLWPRIILSTTILFSVIMIIKAYYGKGVASPIKLAKKGETFYMMIASVIYLVLLNFIGFIILTPLWTMFMFNTMGYKNKKTSAIVSLILTGLIFYVFKKLLYVPVPLGILSNFL